MTLTHSTPVSTDLAVAHICFRAMSTEVNVTVVGGSPDLLDWAHQRIDQLEARWSRFRPDSEISQLNAASGHPLTVSDDTVLAVHTACAAALLTRGRFDPTVHDSLLRLGYDDTIDVVRERFDDRSTPAGPIATLPAPGCTGIVADPASGMVIVPADVRLDLGGIGKGLAADLTAMGLIERGAAGALVNIGGDVRAIGHPANGQRWQVAIDDPRTDGLAATVALLDGGVASSSTLRRRWRHAGVARHHLVAPSSGQSTSNDVVGVAVVAGTAAWADALSKVPFVVPYDDESFRVASALVFHADGSTTVRGPVDLRV